MSGGPVAPPAVRDGSLQSEDRTSKGPLSWTSWPLRDDFPRSLALVAIVVGTSIGVAISFASAALGLVWFAVLALSLFRYLVPGRYVLDERGVLVAFAGRSRFRPWTDFRAYYLHRDGVHLSPFPRPSPLDAFRGLYVRFARNGEAVRAFVAAHVRR